MDSAAALTPIGPRRPPLRSAAQQERSPPLPAKDRSCADYGLFLSRLLGSGMDLLTGRRRLAQPVPDLRYKPLAPRRPASGMHSSISAPTARYPGLPLDEGRGSSPRSATPARFTPAKRSPCPDAIHSTPGSRSATRFTDPHDAFAQIAPEPADILPVNGHIRNKTILVLSGWRENRHTMDFRVTDIVLVGSDRDDDPLSLTRNSQALRSSCQDRRKGQSAPSSRSCNAKRR